MECCCLQADCEFSEGSVRREHFVKACDTIASLEVGDVGANGMDNACDIISLIDTRDYVYV